MHINFETSVPNGFQSIARYDVSCAGNYLEGRLDPKGVVDIHKLFAEFQSHTGFHIMGDNCAAFLTLRPEPNKWDADCIARPKRKCHDAFKDLVDCPVNRPAWKRLPVPAFQPKTRTVPPSWNWHAAPGQLC